MAPVQQCTYTASIAIDNRAHTYTHTLTRTNWYICHATQYLHQVQCQLSKNILSICIVYKSYTVDSILLVVVCLRVYVIKSVLDVLQFIHFFVVEPLIL